MKPNSKTCILFSIIIIFSLSLHAQQISDKDLPVAVAAAFNTAYANAKNVFWAKNADKNYVVSFEWKNRMRKSTFYQDGFELIHRTSIPVVNIPKEVIDALNENYDAYKILSADSVQDRFKSVTVITEANAKTTTPKNGLSSSRLIIHLESNGKESEEVYSFSSQSLIKNK